MEVKTEAPLTEYFDATDKGNEWHMKCKVCGKRWAMKKDYGAAPLHLLNHYYGHFPQDYEDDDD